MQQRLIGRPASAGPASPTEALLSKALEATLRSNADPGPTTPEVMEERFRLAASDPRLMLYEQDRELRYTWLYPLQAEHAHAMGRTDYELAEGAPLAELIAAKEQVLNTGVPTRREIELRLAGEIRFYDTYIAPRRSATGEIIGLAGTAQNVTERKRIEFALRESEERLRATCDGAPVGIAEADLEGRLTSVNQRYCAQLGYTAAEMLGRPFTDFMAPEDAAESGAAYRRLVTGEGGAEPAERRYRHKSGRDLWALVTRTIVRDAQGRPKFGMAVVEDITAAKHAREQQQLLYRVVATVNRAASSSEVYEAALDALCQSQRCRRGAILLYDRPGVMRFVAWRGLSERYRRAVEGHSPWARDDPDPQPVCVPDVAALEPPLRALAAAEGIGALAFVPLTFEQRLLGKFMVYFDAPHALLPEQLRMAETIARQVSFSIQRWKQAEELESLVHARTASLREAIEQMEEFSYTVSHDLRAPVRGMVGFAETIIEDYGADLPPELREYLGRIASNARRMDALIRDMLVYSRVARGELTVAELSLDEVLRDALTLCHGSSAVCVDAPLGRAVGHAGSLVQVLANLVTNAMKFVRPGVTPRVHIRSEQNGGRTRVFVRDNGIGIKPELQVRLFKTFERLHPSGQYEGTGIGLAIVRKAIERMGGQVGVASDGQNGSTFWIELPTAAEIA